MRKVDLTELMDNCYAAKAELERRANMNGRDVQIFLHWTACPYGRYFDSYHVNIDHDGTIMLMADLDEVLSHTYMRNTGSIGLTLCCCYNATTNDPGDYPPTQAQIETMAQCIAVLSEALEIPIDKKHVLTHGEIADCEDGSPIYFDGKYGPKTTVEKWDLEVLWDENGESPRFNPWDESTRGGTVLRGKANYYKYKFYGHY